MSIGDTVTVTFDFRAPARGQRPAGEVHYHGPARIVAMDEWPLTEDAIYRVHPTGPEWVRRGDVFVTEQEVES